MVTESASDRVGGLTLPYREFLRELPVGVMVVDGQMELVESNNYVFKAFGLMPSDVGGMHFGDVFYCSAVVDGSSSCGTTDRCRNCSFRNGVAAVLDTRSAIDEILLIHEFSIDGHAVIKWFKISMAYLDSGESGGYVLVTLLDFSKEKANEDLLNHKASVDMPTGAYNKLFLYENIRKLILDKTGFSLAMVDFDHFKHFNDSYGHQMGDRLLAGFVTLASRLMRVSDLCGRFGGEEFLILLPGTNLQHAMSVMERLKDGFTDLGREMVGSPTTFSAGLVWVDMEDPGTCDVDSVVKVADDLLYEAKGSGRDKVIGRVMQ